MSKAYALKRIEEVKSELFGEIEKKYPVCERHEMSIKQTLKLFHEGKIKLKPAKRLSAYVLRQVFEYPVDEKMESNRQKNVEAKNKLCKEVTKVKDELMLGDSEVAMKLIESLRKFKI